jgi:hypothetical protein
MMLIRCKFTFLYVMKFNIVMNQFLFEHRTLFFISLLIMVIIISGCVDQSSLPQPPAFPD